jgi:hypothetical protein
LPVTVLSAVYQDKFSSYLRTAFANGRLRLAGRLSALSEPAAFYSWLEPLSGKPWVVYSKAPFAGPEVVLKYLARYTHRVAISNHRLVAMADDKVTFTYKDYAAGGKQRTLPVSGEEFLRRFLQHVLPKGFVKVRHYGLLANGQRERKLALCRWLLALVSLVLACPPATSVTPAQRHCPICEQGNLHWVGDLPGGPQRRVGPRSVDTGHDTS